MNFERYKILVVGKTLTNIFHTQQDGPYDYMPGISPAYYFSTVLELNKNQNIQLSSDFLKNWEDTDTLYEVTNQNWLLPENLVFKERKIINLTQDEFRHLTIHLDNETTINHTTDYGDQLFIENPGIQGNSTSKLSTGSCLDLYSQKLKQIWHRLR